MDSKDENRAPETNAQLSNFVQSIGCTLVIDPLDFKVLAYSENCVDLLGVSSVDGLMGSDARDLFTPSSNTSLSQAIAICNSSGIPCLTPTWVQTTTNATSFYAILHSLDSRLLIIDFEPAKLSDLSSTHAETICETAASRLQSLPTRGRNDIGVLCDALVEELQKLTGFDRVIVCNFDGEVYSENKRPDLEPYLGLLPYPVNQCRVTMVCDRTSEPVKVIQSPELVEPLCLDSSTLRAPNAREVQCMTNTGSIASLVLAILVDKDSSLWGVVVCHHHTGPRHIPILDRFACEVVLKVFQVELDRILRKHMLMPPEMKDLVRSDGVATIIGGESRCMGVTPDESQLKDLAEWVMRTHGDCKRLFTESLAGAGYPGADKLEGVCGMAALRISSSGFLFLFRSNDGENDSSLRWEEADIESALALRDIIKEACREKNMEEGEELVDVNMELAIVKI